jgi:hypothetical protein
MRPHTPTEPEVPNVPGWLLTLALIVAAILAWTLFK